MVRKIEVQMDAAKIYHPELKSALHESLEPFPGTSGRPFAVGMSASIDDDKVDIRSDHHAWWIDQEEDRIACNDVSDLPYEMQRHCAHVAFATVGDNRTRHALRTLLMDSLLLNEEGPTHADYDIHFLRQGVIAHFSWLAYHLSLNRAEDPGPIDLDVCRSGIVAIYPEDASHHEKMAFLEAANAYLARRIAEDLASPRADSYRELFDDLEISLVY